MHEGTLVSKICGSRIWCVFRVDGPRYECVSYPNTSLHLTRSRIEHDKRRKIWDRGFSAKGTPTYYLALIVKLTQSISAERLRAAR